jgi:hypothetical protein
VPIRLAAPLVIVAFAALLLGGCGGSSSDEGSMPDVTIQGGKAPPGADTSGAPVGAAARSCDTDTVDVEELRATGVSCGQARQVMYGWQRASSCAGSSGASRSACTSRSYRCLSTRTDRGLAVSCSRPGRSIAFIAKRD